MGPKGMPDTKADRPTDRWSQHQLNSTQPRQTGRLTVGRDITLTAESFFLNPVLGGITGPPCFWGIQIRGPGLQDGGVSNETVKSGYGSWATRPESDCTANDRPVLSSERKPYMKKERKKLSNIRKLKFGHRHQRAA
jgi:hypothetical protein